MSDIPSFDSLYNKTLRFLSFRPRSEKEIVDYLTRKIKRQKAKGKIEIQNEKDAESLIGEIIEKLKEYKFVSDLEFAKWWIENRKKGVRLIKLELSQKGITKEIIEEALSQFDLIKKEEDLMEKLIDKKWKLVYKDPKKAYEKMIRFLASRGFDYETAKKAVKNKIKVEISFDE